MLEPELVSVEPELESVEPELESVEPELVSVEPELVSVEPELVSDRHLAEASEWALELVLPELAPVSGLGR